MVARRWTLIPLQNRVRRKSPRCIRSTWWPVWKQFQTRAHVRARGRVPNAPSQDERRTALRALIGSSVLWAIHGRSTWFEGALLLAVYLILALAFYFLP